MRGFGKGRLRSPRGEAVKALGAAVLVGALGVAATLWMTPLKPPDNLPNERQSVQGTEAAAIERALAQRIADGMRVVLQLCAPEFAGRKAGTPGADRAADWLAAELKRIGVAPPMGAPEFRQRFTMPVSLIASRW